MKDLININNELSFLLQTFVEEIAEKNSFEVAAWLKENDIKAANDMRLLQNYAQRTSQLLKDNGWKTAIKITGRQERLIKTLEKLMLSFQRLLEL